MVFFIKNIKIELTENIHGLTLTTSSGEFPLPGQNISETTEILQSNFEIVQKHFIKPSEDKINAEDLHEICLKIVVYYYYLYNSWRTSNPNKKSIDLNFLKKDFDHPYTYDIIIQYFKNKYPEDYEHKSSVMLDIPVEKLLKYEYDRAEFYKAFR